MAWKDFQASADPDELIAVSSPNLILISTATPIAAIMTLAYVPAFARVSRLGLPWVASAFIAVGGLLTFIAWTQRCRGPVGTIATLLDNAFYSLGIALAAASSAEVTGIALAVIHGLMIVSFPARDYALTPLFSLTMTAPIVGVIIWVQPSLPVSVIFVASLVMMHIVSQETRAKRDDRLRQKQLEQALGAADKLADDSVQAALTTTLLTLGHFLHELRNYQTAIAANLEYVEASSELSPDPKEALLEAQEAQQKQAELLRTTIEDLRQRSSGGSGRFRLRQAIEETAASDKNITTEILGDLEYELRGNVEHLRVVLLNLNRNAAQAGARLIQYIIQGEASGNSVRLSINDDGDGLAEKEGSGLFDSFALSDKAGGSGLGLYLVRRYIELLGGTIEVGTSNALGGASFVLHLPAKVLRSVKEKPDGTEPRHD